MAGRSIQRQRRTDRHTGFFEGNPRPKVSLSWHEGFAVLDPRTRAQVSVERVAGQPLAQAVTRLTVTIRLAEARFPLRSPSAHDQDQQSPGPFDHTAGFAA